MHIYSFSYWFISSLVVLVEVLGNWLVAGNFVSYLSLFTII